MTDSEAVIERAKQVCNEIEFHIESKDVDDLARELMLTLSKGKLVIDQIAAVQVLLGRVWKLTSQLEAKESCCQNHGEIFATFVLLNMAAKAANGSKVVSEIVKN